MEAQGLQLPQDMPVQTPCAVPACSTMTETITWALHTTHIDIYSLGVDDLPTQCVAAFFPLDVWPDILPLCTIVWPLFLPHDRNSSLGQWTPTCVVVAFLTTYQFCDRYWGILCVPTPTTAGLLPFFLHCGRTGGWMVSAPGIIYNMCVC